MVAGFEARASTGIRLRGNRKVEFSISEKFPIGKNDLP